MKREIYEFSIVEKLRKTKKGIIVETDINNYSKIEFGNLFYYELEEEPFEPPKISSSTNIVVGKVENIEDLIKLLQPYYPNLVKENLKLLSSVKGTDGNYSPSSFNFNISK